MKKLDNDCHKFILQILKFNGWLVKVNNYECDRCQLAWCVIYFWFSLHRLLYIRGDSYNIKVAINANDASVLSRLVHSQCLASLFISRVAGYRKEIDSLYVHDNLIKRRLITFVFIYYLPFTFIHFSVQLLDSLQLVLILYFAFILYST